MQTELTGLLSLCKLEVSSSFLTSLRVRRPLIPKPTALQSPHAAKIKERPYFNIISILQKVRAGLALSRAPSAKLIPFLSQFPWYQPETWNSQQIVRLYNTSCGKSFLIIVRDRTS